MTIANTNDPRLITSIIMVARSLNAITLKHPIWCTAGEPGLVQGCKLKFCIYLFSLVLLNVDTKYKQNLPCPKYHQFNMKVHSFPIKMKMVHNGKPNDSEL